jgi:hypothetical protein
MVFRRSAAGFILVCLTSAGCSSSRGGSSQPAVETPFEREPKPIAGPAYEFTNARWFTGDGFRYGTRFTVNGVFVAERPARIDSTLDLGGGFVIPPFGDAHTHNLDGSRRLDEVRAASKGGRDGHGHARRPAPCHV